ncbi:hypothetical protein ACFV2Q_17005 [Streptomyces sp. NPDC059650]|uniref:hypothetical protein n=1 Tax=Streptomyces sp. NPDC059650 TaxID=3346896 RepID=UPI0036CA4190
MDGGGGGAAQGPRDDRRPVGRLPPPAGGAASAHQARRPRLAAWTTGAGDPAQGRRLYRELAGSGPADRISLLARLGAIRAGFLGGDTEAALDRLEDLLPGLTAEYGLQHAVVLAARVQQIRGRRRAGKRRPCTLDALEGLVHEAIEHLGPAHPLTLYVRGRHARSVDNHGDRRGRANPPRRRTWRPCGGWARTTPIPC